MEENYKLFTSDVTILELDSAGEDIGKNLLKVIQKYRIKIVSITIRPEDLQKSTLRVG